LRRPSSPLDVAHAFAARCLLRGPSTGLNDHPSGRSAILLRPTLQNHPCWCRNIRLLPIDYAFLPRLRDRLTLRRLSLPRNPRVYGDRVFHPVYRYSCQHQLLSALQRSFPYAFTAQTILAYRLSFDRPGASAHHLDPLNFRRRFTRPVSCYAFFKGWLLLSQPPGCLSAPTSFTT
jgi:hypothetical protein